MIWGLPVLSGVLYGLSFPPFNLSFLAWFALVPLLLKPSFRGGVIAGFIANLIIFFWMWKTFLAAHIGVVTTLASWLVLASILSLYFGVFVVCYRRMPDRWWRPWVISILWVVLEQIRSVILTGFPWALIAHTQVYSRAFMQVASFSREWGLAWLIVTANALAAQIFLRRTRSSVVSLTGFVVLVGGVYAWGSLRVGETGSLNEMAPKFKVAILQGNIDQYQKWDETYEHQIRERYQTLVNEAAKSKPDLIVWPESSVPGWFPNDAGLVAWVKDVVVKSGTHHLIGAVSAHDGGEFNAAFLLSPKGDILRSYDKQKMVPFGEYIPFGGFLKRYVPYLGQLGTFNAGHQFVLFEVNGVKLAPNICYEMFFPRLIKKSVAPGAEVIVNITNDGWFLDTGAPEQHFVVNIFRAIETRRPVIRAANTGISAAIDSSGRLLVRSPLLTSGVYLVEIPLTTRIKS